MCPTVTVCPKISVTLPTLGLTNPGKLEESDGWDQPAGTVRATAPFTIPPVATLYVKMMVLPPDPSRATWVGVVNVPDPSGAFTVITGDRERFLNVSPELEPSWACHVCTPGAADADAPGPPPVLSP